MSTNHRNNGVSYTIREQLETLYVEGKWPGHLLWGQKHDELRRKILRGQATPKEVDSYAHSLLLKERKDRLIHRDS